MNSVKRTITFVSPDIGFIEDAARPILPFAQEVEDASCAAAHSHPRAQMIFSSRGIMRVFTHQHTWFVPPTQAVYVPPFTEHEVHFPGKVTIRNLFIDQTAACSLATSCFVFDVTPLLRELVSRFVTRPPRFDSDGVDFRLAAVILDELLSATPAPLNLPTSIEPRLACVMEGLLHQPGDKRTLDAWAATANTSPRTLARLFLRDTGLSFADWRTQLRMLEGLDRLSQGQPVTMVALDLGYGDASAFIAAFRRKFGVSPGRYAR